MHVPKAADAQGLLGIVIIILTAHELLPLDLTLSPMLHTYQHV